MSIFWSIWVIVLFLATVVGSCWLLIANRKVEVKDKEGISPDSPPKTGHVYDGIEEYDNPLPGWWFKMFLGTAVFALLYVIFYPGLGSYAGVLGWTSTGQWQEQVDEAEARYADLFAGFSDQSVTELAANPEALKIGRRLFANNCSTCHGSDGRGSYGFPNLADESWLYGGSPDVIKTSITHGRKGAMPAWGPVIGEEAVQNVTEYVFRLGARAHDADRAEKGAQVYSIYCVACHGTDGKGNPALGAPNLTDNIWLYGGSAELVRHSIRSGRNGNMPAQGEHLKADKIHLLTAYVYSLSTDVRR